MGESVAQFTKSFGFDLADCRQLAQLSEKEARKQKLTAKVWLCTGLSAAEEGQSLVLWRGTDPLIWSTEKNVTFVQLNPGEKGIAFRKGSSLPSVYGDDVTVFEAGKLVEFQVEPGLKYSFDDLIDELRAKYLPPTQRFTETLQNSYGAKVDFGSALWEFGDGSEIIVQEKFLYVQGIGPVRPVTVTYRTKERVAEIAAHLQKPKALD